jgi:hypothetical protein
MMRGIVEAVVYGNKLDCHNPDHLAICCGWIAPAGVLSEDVVDAIGVISRSIAHDWTTVDRLYVDDLIEVVLGIGGSL